MNNNMTKYGRINLRFKTSPGQILSLCTSHQNLPHPSLAATSTSPRIQFEPIQSTCSQKLKNSILSHSQQPKAPPICNAYCSTRARPAPQLLATNHTVDAVQFKIPGGIREINVAESGGILCFQNEFRRSSLNVEIVGTFVYHF
jgi:hypothetical protein